MSIRYESNSERLSDVIKKATTNATYVVPDLQRPYVWTPRQVTLLIDSLFRGWPFGSLLVWEVKPDCFEQNEGIPHRPFWQLVDRTDGETGTTASPLGQPATYHMVLDGQQRIQSLILALGGDQWGFRLYDYEWALDLEDRRVKPSVHWSTGALCLDLEKFRSEVHAKAGKVRRLEAGKIIDWAVLDRIGGQSADVRPPNYRNPLLTAWQSEGRFVRLSRIWDLVQQELTEQEYEELLTPMLEEHRVPQSAFEEVLRPLAQYLKVMENIKSNSFVYALRINSFQLTPQWTKDDYSEAIVNIFTRLNTAGRTLTREEITLAWLKIGWMSKDTEGKPAGTCLEDLKTGLADQGFRLETDEAVRLISFVWAVEDPTRKGALLEAKDLLKGEIVRSLAGRVSQRWMSLKPMLVSGAERIRERALPDGSGSFNAIIVLLTWYCMVFERFEEVSGLKVVQRDDIEKQLRKRANEFTDRWVFASEWAGVWGDSAGTNFQNFASDLSNHFDELKACSPAELIAVVERGIERLMNRVGPRAIQYVDNLQVRDRRRVHMYFQALWVWHRLDGERWKASSLPMRTGRKKVTKLEVDHVIADAWWQRQIARNVEEKLAAYLGPEAERPTVPPDGFKSRWEAYEFINSLGNCSLLEKTFNISKSDGTLWGFLQEVHEFRSGTLARKEWQQALQLTDTLTNPVGIAIADLRHGIEARDALIRGELNDFIGGNRRRVDIEA